MPKKSKKKKDPGRVKFRKSITIDGEDCYATYWTPEMDKRIKEEREKEARSSGSGKRGS